MKIRKLHRAIGLVMLLPLFGWAITGLIFFIKPGYDGAYEVLQPKTYPLEGQLSITPDPLWLEVKYLRTILGNHLLVRTEKGWQQLDPATRTLRNKPSAEEIKLLVRDACLQNPGRYGQVATISDETVITDTNVQVTLYWNRMSLQQRGKDTEWIDRLYKIHYLQWTGVKAVDVALGAIGLTLIAVLSILGLLLGFNLKLSKSH